MAGRAEIQAALTDFSNSRVCLIQHNTSQYVLSDTVRIIIAIFLFYIVYFSIFYFRFRLVAAAYRCVVFCRGCRSDI